MTRSQASKNQSEKPKPTPKDKPGASEIKPGAAPASAPGAAPGGGEAKSVPLQEGQVNAQPHNAADRGPGGGDENPLDTLLEEESADSAPANAEPPSTPPSLALAPGAAPGGGEAKSEDEKPEEDLPSEAADTGNTGTVLVEAPENPVPYPTSYIPAPAECLSDGPKFRSRRFTAVPPPSEMTSDLIEAELQLLGEPGKTRDELAELCATARHAKVEAMRLHDIAIATAEQTFREFDEWFYAANHRIAALKQEEADRNARAESAKLKASEAKKPPTA